jgi:RNA polymerase sigma-70 factor (ECF subfamily)
VLAKIEGKSHKEISEKIGISIKTVENHMNRAYKELRELLKNKLQ